MQPAFPVPPYLFGVLALGLMYLISVIVTRKWSPFALAEGHNEALSTSLFQNLVFTALTVFCYVTLAAARAMETGALVTLPNIPVNLLLLMGLSVTTAATSKAVTISYLQQNRLPADDRSNLVDGRTGTPELTKVQMLIWTLVAVGVYVMQFNKFLVDRAYLDPTQFALPDVDGALLVLMGASQGGYVAGKIVGKTLAAPQVESLLPTSGKAGDEVTLLGNFFSDSKEGNNIVFRDVATSQEYGLPADKIREWLDTRIRFEIPDKTKLPIATYELTVRVSGQKSESKEFGVTP